MFSRHYAKYYEVLNREKKYESEISWVCDWVKNTDRILDIGCGTANYWKFFPKGSDVVGIERSSEMVREAGPGKYIYNFDIEKMALNPMVDFNLVTALFEVVNYIPTHSWWKDLPLKPRGSFIFDVWDKEKVDRDGFRKTDRKVGDVRRVIFPIKYDGHEVRLRILLFGPGFVDTEVHKMYLFSRPEIESMAEKNGFEISGIRETNGWQTWYKLRKK